LSKGSHFVEDLEAGFYQADPKGCSGSFARPEIEVERRL
jgi:hypothetical protein